MSETLYDSTYLVMIDFSLADAAEQSFGYNTENPMILEDIDGEDVFKIIGNLEGNLGFPFIDVSAREFTGLDVMNWADLRANFRGNWNLEHVRNYLLEKYNIGGRRTV